MPTYDYLCESCSYKLEIFQSIKARAKRKCPQCGKNQLKRLIGTGAGIIFKGSGFYETDYRSEDYKQAKKKAEKPAVETKSKKDTKTKTETKSATKLKKEVAKTKSADKT
ncbi:MAG: FmdB family zinc ribbon protein [Planctomycetota bacterium]|jgi:putative FmdB family regulatory protein